MDGHRTGPEPARMQIYGTERAGDLGAPSAAALVRGSVIVEAG
ncbi:hypothetical protein ACK8N7_15320 [Streptomyces griseobrunneus]